MKLLRLASLIGLIEEGAEAGNIPKIMILIIVQAGTTNEANNNQHLSPAPRKIAAEHNIDTSKISGSGKDGRVTKGDVLEVVNNPTAAVAANTKPVEKVRMSKLRQKIAERLKESQNTAAILTTFNEVDMTEIIALRKNIKIIF